LKREHERLTALFYNCLCRKTFFGVDFGAVKGVDMLQPVVEYMPEFFFEKKNYKMIVQ
jgi:hypothetical protein